MPAVMCGCLECNRQIMISKQERDRHHEEGLVVVHQGCCSPQLQLLTLVRRAQGYKLYAADPVDPEIRAGMQT